MIRPILSLVRALLMPVLLLVYHATANAQPSTYHLQIDPSLSIIHTAEGYDGGGFGDLETSGSFLVTLELDPFRSPTENGTIQFANLDVTPAPSRFGRSLIGFVFPTYPGTYQRVVDRITFEGTQLHTLDWPGHIGYSGSFNGDHLSLAGSHYDGWPDSFLFDGYGYQYEMITTVIGPPLQAGDANQDLFFDQQDISQALQAGRYVTGDLATWGEGDWNGAPGGYPGSPPAGDGVFDQLDIVSALQAGTYLSGSYAAVLEGGVEGDDRASVGYDARTGEIWVDPPADREFTSVHIVSTSDIFTGDPPIGVAICDDFGFPCDDSIFRATFSSSFGPWSFGNVAQAGLSKEFVLNDLTVTGTLTGGAGLSDVDLIYIPVPEPSTILLAALGFAGLLPLVLRQGERCSSLLPSRRPVSAL